MKMSLSHFAPQRIAAKPPQMRPIAGAASPDSWRCRRQTGRPSQPFPSKKGAVMADAPEALVKDGEGTYSVFSHEQAERARVPEEPRTLLDAWVGDVGGHIIDLDPSRPRARQWCGRRSSRGSSVRSISRSGHLGRR